MWVSHDVVEYSDYPMYTKEVIDEAVKIYKDIYGVDNCRPIKNQKYTFVYILRFANDWKLYTSMLKNSEVDLSKIAITKVEKY